MSYVSSCVFFFFSSRRRHTRYWRDWSSDVCSSDLFNMIPRSGGNEFSGTYFANYAGEWSQGSNIDDRLKSLGFTDGAALIKSWDTNFALGGPILRDRLWFFGNVRSDGTHQDVPRTYANANAGNPNLWTYAPDTSIKVRNAQSNLITGVRTTWQATTRNKLGYY